MYVVSWGAVRQVTGSMHMLVTDDDVILFDCGMFQGKRKESAERNRVIPFDPKLISSILLSHAHIDHCGRIPLFTKGEFNGRIICTRATADAAAYLLADSARIQESDAEYLNYKTVKSFLHKKSSSSGDQKISNSEAKKIKKLLHSKKNRLNTGEINRLIDKYHLTKIEPLYTSGDTENSLDFFKGYPYKHPIEVGKNAVCTLYDAGHILGSAMVHVKVREKGKQYSILFTGDIGRYDKPIIKNPSCEFAEEDRDIDLLIMESTYGNRLHDPVIDLKPMLKKVIIETEKRGGSIMIPAFAYGRTQEIIYYLHELYMEGDVPKMPIYVDSPLANKLTKVFGEHPETYDQDTHEAFLEKGINPFLFKEINFVSSVEESMALNRDERPHIVLAGSGMCEGGRILHHLRHKIEDEKNTVLIVGYMAANTMGRRLLDLGQKYEQSGRKGKVPVIRFYNADYQLKAHVIKLGGFSGHGDKNEMTRFLKDSKLNIKKIAVVHGEEEQSLSFAEYLRENGYNAFVPTLGESVTVGED